MAGWGPAAAAACIFLLGVLPAVASEDGAGIGGLFQKIVSIEDNASGAEVMAALQSGQVVDLAFDRMNLTETLRVDVNNVKIRGRPGGSKPVIKCPPNASAFSIRASNVSLERIVFEGCGNVESVVSVKPAEDPGIPTYEMKTPTLLISGVILSEIEIKKYDDSVQKMNHDGKSGISIERASVSILNSKFAGGVARSGGVVHVKYGLLLVQSSEFSDNKAKYEGGAIWFQHQAEVNDTLPSELKVGLNISSCTFTENMAIIDFESNSVTRLKGHPLEPLVVFEFPETRGQGGALWIGEVDKAVVENSTFLGNKAPTGGAIYFRFDPVQDVLHGIGNLKLTNCDFFENTAMYPKPLFKPTRDEYRLHGGAIFGAIGLDDYSLDFRDCNFKGNNAGTGGAVHMVTSSLTKVMIGGCEFSNNSAKSAGGAVVLRNTARVTWYNSNVRNCRAQIGGGVLLTNNAGITILGPDPRGNNGYKNSIFESNMAIDGAGFMCAMCGATVLQSPWFKKNHASRNGGGLAVLNAVTDVYVYQGIFESNIAMRGGGAHVDTAFSLHFSTVAHFEDKAPTKFLNNTAVSGAGALFIPRSLRSNSIQITGVHFERNSAELMKTLKPELKAIEDALTAGGVVKLLADALVDSPTPVVNEMEHVDCGLGGGGGVCVVLDLIHETSKVRVLLDDCKFIGNRASVGGGAYLRVSTFQWQAQLCQENSGPTSTPCRSFQLIQPLFKDNTAVLSGGGLFVSDPTKISIPKCVEGLGHSNEFRRLDELWKNSLLDEFCFRFESNSVKDGQYGNDMASRGAALQLVDSWELLTNQTSGQKLLPDPADPSRNIRLRVVDSFNQTVTHGFPEAGADVRLGSTGIASQLTYKATEGVVEVTNTNAIGEHQVHQIVFSSDRLNSTEVSFSIRNCYPGELETPEFKECIPCKHDYYGFLPQESCVKCEPNAICTGGASLVPKPGYWHSSPFSPTILGCISKDACDLPNRTELLLNYTSELASLTPSSQPVSNVDYPLCAQGYTGVLCGSCKESYGHLPGGKCVQCHTRTFASGMLAGTLLVSIIYVLFQVLSTFLATKDSSPQTNVVESPNRSTIASKDLSDIVQINQNNSDCSPAETSDCSQEETAEKLVETLKIFMNYAQATKLALSISVHWSVVEQISHALGLITNSPSELALDCCTIGEHDVPRSVLASYLRILVQVLPLLFFLTIFGLLWLWNLKSRAHLDSSRVLDPRRPADSLVFGIHKISTCCIMVTIIVSSLSYNGITKELMRAFNCVSVKIHSDVSNPFLIYVLAPTKRLWAEDTSLTCYEGYHLGIVAVGALGLLLYTLGYMCFSGAVLWNNESKARDAEFRARYGFLYRAYKIERKYWEVAVTLRKALLSSILVFAYPLGTNLQAALAAGVLVLALIAHLIFMPLKEYSTLNGDPPQNYQWLYTVDLNTLEAGSLFLSSLTFYCGVIFNDPNTSEGGAIATKVFIFLLHLCYTLFIVGQVVQGAQVFLVRWIRQLWLKSKSLIFHVFVTPTLEYYGHTNRRPSVANIEMGYSK